MRGLVVLFLLLVPSIEAGSAEDPEIRDETGDVRWSPVPLSPEPIDPPLPHAAAFDIIASWFHNETPTAISATMQVASLVDVDDFQAPRGFARWGTRFELSNYEPTDNGYWNRTWIMAVDVDNGASGWQGYLSLPDRGPDAPRRAPADFHVDRTAHRITVTMERTVLGSPMAGDRLDETMSLHDGQYGAGTGTIDYHDQAPDGTYPSRPYVFTMDTGETAPGQADPPAEDKRSPAPAGLLLTALALWRRR